MASPTSATPAPAPVGSLEELQHVKDAEAEWTARVRAARDEGEATLKRLREEADGRIGLARTAAQQTREERVSAAKKEAGAQATQILFDGDRQARAVVAEPGKRPADRREEILSAVLSEFRTD